MKMLCVRQPYAGMIASGKKTLEIRTWRTRYRGPLIIAASAKRYENLPVGVTIAMVELVDCRPMRPKDADETTGDYDEACFAFVLKNPRRLPHVPVKGKLGIFEAPQLLLPSSIAPSKNHRRRPVQQ